MNYTLSRYAYGIYTALSAVVCPMHHYLLPAIPNLQRGARQKETLRIPLNGRRDRRAPWEEGRQTQPDQLGVGKPLRAQRCSALRTMLCSSSAASG